ncbi:MAG: DUF305 domain-containing protein [Gemmatimonadota bacterium]|nr:DUF305 domain-containing protein [Gemmatimonadota bacterium]
MAQAPLAQSFSLQGVDSADVSFVQGMMHHHAQAIVMSRMAPSHTTRADLRTTARKIVVSQRDEIALMRRWLEKHGQTVPAIDTAPPDTARMMPGMQMSDGDHAAHHMMMPGMLTAEMMGGLARAHGAKFDSLYLSDIIAHHRGALAMVAKLFATPGASDDSEIFQLASEIDADQSAEIARMQSMQLHPPKKTK